MSVSRSKKVIALLSDVEKKLDDLLFLIQKRKELQALNFLTQQRIDFFIVRLCESLPSIKSILQLGIDHIKSGYYLGILSLALRTQSKMLQVLILNFHKEGQK